MPLTSYSFDFSGSHMKERNSTCGCGYRTQRLRNSGYAGFKAVPPEVRRSSSNITSFANYGVHFQPDTSRSIQKNAGASELGPGCLGIVAQGHKLQPNVRETERKNIPNLCADDLQFINSIQKYTCDDLEQWSNMLTDSSGRNQPKAPCSSPVEDLCTLIRISPEYESEELKAASYIEEPSITSRASGIKPKVDLNDKTKTGTYVKQINFHIPVGNQVEDGDDTTEVSPRRKGSVKASADSITFENETIDKEIELPGSLNKDMAKQNLNIGTSKQHEIGAAEFESHDKMCSYHELNGRILDTLFFVESLQTKQDTIKYNKEKRKPLLSDVDDECSIQSDTSLLVSRKAKKLTVTPQSMTVNCKPALERPMSDYQIRKKQHVARPLTGRRVQQRSILKSSLDSSVDSCPDPVKTTKSQSSCTTSQYQCHRKTSSSSYDENQLQSIERTTPLIWETIAGINNDDSISTDEPANELVKVEEAFSETLTLEDDRISIVNANINPEEPQQAWQKVNEDCRNDLKRIRKTVTFDDDTRPSTQTQTESNDKISENVEVKKIVNLRPTARVRKAYREQKKKLEEIEQKRENCRLKSRVRPKSSHPRLQATKSTTSTPLSANLVQEDSGKSADLSLTHKKAQKHRRIKSAKSTSDITVQQNADKVKITNRPKTAVVSRRNSKTSPSCDVDPCQAERTESDNKPRPISAPAGMLDIDECLQVEDSPSKECQDIFVKCQDSGINLSMKTLCRALMPPREDPRLQAYNRLPSTMTGLLTRPQTWFKKC